MMTIEELDMMYQDKEDDRYYLEMQARIGSEDDRKRAYDADGNFHCINWYDCRFCPAFQPEHCL